MKKTLHLTLKRKWFEMILSGEKKEEYREIKDYWWNRLVSSFTYKGGLNNACKENKVPRYFHRWDTITFKNGYAKNAPLVEIKLEYIKIDTGNVEWGAVEGIDYFVLSLGEIIRTENLD